MQLNDDGSPLAAPVVLTESLTPTQIVADSGRFLLLLTGDDGIRASWIAPNLDYSPVFRIAADARSARAAALPDGRVAIAINRDAGTSLTFLTPPRARAVRR
jgi:hypothetical protein